MKGLRRHPFRVLGRLLWFVGEVIIALFDFLIRCAFRPKKSALAARALWLQRASRRHLRIFKFEAQVAGPVPSGGLLVSNHLSYLDVPVMASLTPAVFVAKHEIKSWPVIGWLARLAGTLFIDRDRRMDVAPVNAAVQTALDGGALVVVFPEGTSSDGQTVAYRVLVKNTSRTELELSVLSDPGCTGVSPSGAQKLAVAATATYTCHHTLTSAGTYDDQASIQGSVEGGRSTTHTSNTVEVSVAPTVVAVVISAPLITALKQSHSSWREAGRAAKISKAHPLGTTFSFSLNETASVSFTFTRTLNGRRVAGKCRAQSKKNIAHKACKRTLKAGALTFSGHLGINKVAFYGLLGAGKKLTPGSYTLLVSATAAGKRSRTQTLRFTITRH